MSTSGNTGPPGRFSRSLRPLSVRPAYGGARLIRELRRDPSSIWYMRARVNLITERARRPQRISGVSPRP